MDYPSADVEAIFLAKPAGLTILWWFKLKVSREFGAHI